jgi:ATP-dependent DNA ligase
MALAVAPPRKTRFGGTLALSKVHWTKPELVAEITYPMWGEEGLLRHTVFVGLREDKPAREVRRRNTCPQLTVASEAAQLSRKRLLRSF